jgi:hypothetical protein
VLVTKMLLLRVGIDSGCGRTLAPIFADGTFEYVPIPEGEQRWGPRSVYFRDLPARHGGTLAQHVPKRYRESAAHHDPEFDTFSYGDPTRNKRGQLLRLDAGDFLTFYAGLRPHGCRGGGRLYIIGYFTVHAVYSFDSAGTWPPAEAQHLLNNAHFRRSQADNGLVVVHGDACTSRLLDRAMLISDEAQRATVETQTKLGIRGSLQRAIGRWVPPEYMGSALDWIVHR